MFCRVCNTRIDKGRSACPNCGSNAIHRTPDQPNRLSAPLPQPAYGSSSGPDASGELDVTEEVERMADRIPEVELDDPAEVELDEPAEVGLDRVQRSRETDSKRAEEKDDPPSVSTDSRTRETAAPDPDGVRAMLAQAPEVLEAGLSIYTSEKGTPLGVGYTSAVGEIDLLARDAQGDLVVVMVAGCDEGAEVISGMLQRIGWVTKHLSGKAKQVRGIVLLEEVDDSIAYAAAAVGSTLSFKTWQLALTFDDVVF